MVQLTIPLPRPAGAPVASLKALTLREPWLSMIVDGHKTVETRTWFTAYRGDLLLVGPKKPEGRNSGLAVCVV